jgi:hypothetical protein
MSDDAALEEADKQLLQDNQVERDRIARKSKNSANEMRDASRSERKKRRG